MDLRAGALLCLALAACNASDPPVEVMSSASTAGPAVQSREAVVEETGTVKTQETEA